MHAPLRADVYCATQGSPRHLFSIKHLNEVKEMTESFSIAGISLGLGSFFLLGLGVLFDLHYPGPFVRYLNATHVPKAISTTFVLAIAFIVGLLLENVSSYIADEFNLITPLPGEKELRVKVFVDSKLDHQYRNSEEMMALLAKISLPKNEEDLIKNGMQGHPLSLLSINTVYYTGKNLVYRNDNYFKELSHYQTRINFARSFTLASLLLLAITLASLFSFLIRTMHKKAFTHVCLLSVAFAVLYILGRYAYTSEEIEFNKRVFGYFLSIIQTQDFAN